MKKLTTSVLAVVLTSSFALVNAQTRDTLKTQNIDEVIVTGALGIKRTADAVTSAQQQVTTEQLTLAGNPNAVQALSGKVAGLQINQTNSSVNSTSRIQLRGIRTITGNNDALIVIDNVISNATVLETLPPDVIESINVIKGAQGAALYGADGVNGAVIVTTKQGSKRGLSINYDATMDFESVAFVPKRQTRYGQGWYNARDQYENGAWGPRFDGSNTAYGVPLRDVNNDGIIELDGIGWGDGLSPDGASAIFAPYSARPDELKKFFRTGALYNNSITLNAGDSDKFALLNITNTVRDFIIQDDNFEKNSVLFKGSSRIGKLTVQGSVNYIRTDTKQSPLMFDEGQDDSIFWNLLQSSPDIPIRQYSQYADNAYAWNIYYQNPYWRIKHVRGKSKSDYYNVIAGLNYDLNENISVRYTGNLQQRYTSTQNTRDGFDTDMYTEDISGISSALFINKRDWYDYYGDLLINFNYDLTDDLNAKLNVGHNYQDHRYSVMQNGGTNLEIPGIYNMSNVTQPLPASSLSNGDYRDNSHSVFANLDLSYKNFLFLNATARNEWSSVLPKDNNSYFYPSVGLSFVPTKIWDFGGDVLTRMKISGNWTRVGNSSAIPRYRINKSTVLGSGFPFDGNNSYRNEMTQADKDIRPEFVTTKEINLDLGFWRDRITLDGSIYEQDTKDLITDQRVSSASGINYVLINIGKMRSRGAEINLGITPVKTSKIRWDINAGYSYTESRVLKVSDDTDEVAITAFTNFGVYAQAGSLFPLIKTSMMERDDQGRIIIDADTGNPLITSQLLNAGVAVPKSIYNFSTNLRLGDFKIGAVADLRFGSKFIANVINGMAFNGTLYESGQIDRENGGFIMPNSVIMDASGNYVPNTTIKTGGDDYNGVNDYYSSIYGTIGENYLIDGDAFKIREVSLSYSLPKTVLYGTPLQELTIGVHARNPFQKFASNNLNYADPETSYYSTPGIAQIAQYPNTKVYGFSVNVKF